MLPKNEILNGTMTLTNYSPTGAVVDSQVFDRERGSDFVAQNSVNGDKHAPNAYDFSTRRVSQPFGTIVRKSADGSINQIQDGYFPGLYSFDFDIVDEADSLYNSALSSLNERARGSLDVSTDILEFRQTLKMFAGATSIRTYLGNTIRAATKRGRQPKGDTTLKQLVRDAGGNWLQWKLGLSPLLSTFHDIVKEVNTSVVLKTMRVQGKRSKPIVAKELLGDTDVTRITKVECSGVQGCDIRVQFRPSDSARVLRWASLNPIGWAWELTTLSFVVDYFYDVGGFLKDSETALAYANTFDSGYTTALFAFDARCVTRGNVGSLSYNLVGGVRVVKFRRAVLGSWPFPRAPTFQRNLSSGRMLTIAALLSQGLKRA